MLLLPMLLVCSGVLAQSITPDELMPVLNSIDYYHFNEFPLDEEQVPNPGIGVTWDFSTLAPIDSDMIAYPYVSVESTGYLGEFPGADYAINIFPGGLGVESFGFFNLTDGYYTQMGDASSNGVNNSTPINECALPIEIGNNVVEYVIYDLGVLRARYAAETNGYGTLVLPDGATFSEVFLVSIAFHIDSWDDGEWYTDESQYNYSFYQAGHARPILELWNFYVDGEYDETHFFFYANNETLVDEQEQGEWTIFPNPASDYLNVFVEVAHPSCRVIITEMCGKKVSEESL